MKSEFEREKTAGVGESINNTTLFGSEIKRQSVESNCRVLHESVKAISSDKSFESSRRRA